MFRTFTARGENRPKTVRDKRKAQRMKGWALRKEGISGPVDARAANDYVEDKMPRPHSSLQKQAFPGQRTPLGGQGSIRGDTTAVPSEHQGDHILDPCVMLTESPSAEIAQPPQGPLGAPESIQHMDNIYTLQQVSSNLVDLKYRARQHVRARSRATSVNRTVPDIPQVPLITHIRGAYNNPVRSHIPEPVLSRHTGLGGLPGPLQVLLELLPKAATTHLAGRLGIEERAFTILANGRTAKLGAGKKASSRQEDREFEDRELGPLGALGAVKVQVARWMPETLSDLVIGRNGRFFSEELNDDDLE
jgi:hypothetical protein